ncbi:hypothetical protein QBC40DRAFT_189047, partial [Triangularia verruculosa]
TVITDLGDRMYSTRRDTDKSAKSDASSVGSEATPTSLRCQLHRAIVKPAYHKVETQGFVPKSKLEELVKVDIVENELLKSEKSIRRRLQKASRLDFRPSTSDQLEKQVRTTAEKICGVEQSDSRKTDNGALVFRKILAITLLCGEKKEKVQAFVDEKVSDADLPLIIHTPSKRFELRSKKRPTTRLKCFKSWGREDRKRFESWQWTVLSPYFGRDGHNPTKMPCYALPKATILPFLSWERVGRRGGSAMVYKVAIHQDHHGFEEYAAPGHFAVKFLHFSERKRFEKEVGILKAINKTPHPHLITLLVTYEYQERFHLVFPLAQCDLLQYWEAGEKDQAHNDELTARWLAQQCHGLASGLKQVHQSSRVTSESFAERERLVRRSVFSYISQAHGSQEAGPRLVCQHGDLKPENILLFPDSPAYQSVGGKGILKITDFGEAEFGEYGAVAQKRLPTTPIYQAPEASKALGKLSMGTAYDIWSLGCVFLEFITWCFGGWAYFDAFVSARAEPDPLSVRVPFIDDMHRKPECTRFFHDFLDLIQQEMLIIDPRTRISSVDLEQRLEDLKGRHQFDPGYFREHAGR